MQLPPGTRLGIYEVIGPLGAGGMGEVYRARDTRLDRDVALKLLPEAFARDPERLSRFEREAKVLASLNHPNIAAIYGLEESSGVRFLVMEYVPGEELRGPLPLEDALKTCRQVAEALELAHEKGVVHRDLKPANIKITPEGKVKVLDFGLAKALTDEGSSSPDLSSSPTMADATRAGVILGTAAYMSPEQARGRPVDRRTDIWAFGCVLYEVLSGRRVFAGETASDSMAAILKQDPDWQALPPDTPAAIRNLLRRCLQKDRDRRLQSIGDARIEVDEALSSGPPGSAPSSAPALAQPSRQPNRALWPLLVVLAVFATALATWLLKPTPALAPKRVMRFPLALPAGSLFLQGAISADGSRLVYSVLQPGMTTKLQLQLRSFDQFDASPIVGSDFARHPVFSPDGQWLLFTDGGTRLKKLPVTGGKAELSAETKSTGFSWAFDDTILYADKTSSGIARVPSAGGMPQTLTTPDKQKGEVSHLYPELLPGGKALLLTVFAGGGPENNKVAVHSLETGQRRVLLEGYQARYAPTGHVVFQKGGTLMAAPFDLQKLNVTGPSVPIAEVPFNWNGAWGFSNQGTLFYAQPPSGEIQRSLLLLDRQGASRALTETRRGYESPRFSPDGKRLAVTFNKVVANKRQSDVWILDIGRDIWARVTTDGRSRYAIWSPDGKRVAYSSSNDNDKRSRLMSRLADGSAPEEEILSGENIDRPTAWSSDGASLAYIQSDGNRDKVWLLPLPKVNGEGKPRLLLQSKSEEQGAAFSPDGHWIAYVSNESGESQVYVQPFPGPGPREQISTEKGESPAWSRSGRELFYLNGNKLMAVAIATKPVLTASKPQLLFETQNLGQGYDVTPDGQHFLTIKSEQEAYPTQINVVVNWFEELKRRVK